MRNIHAIGGIARQLQKLSERIELLAMDIDGAENTNNQGIVDLYEDQLLDEVNHAQGLILALTELVVETTGTEGEGSNAPEHGDESAFGPGELDVTQGEAAEEEGEETE